MIIRAAPHCVSCLNCEFVLYSRATRQELAWPSTLVTVSRVAGAMTVGFRALVRSPAWRGRGRSGRQRSAAPGPCPPASKRDSASASSGDGAFQRAAGVEANRKIRFQRGRIDQPVEEQPAERGGQRTQGGAGEGLQTAGPSRPRRGTG